MLAAVVILDKYILARSVATPRLYTVYSTLGSLLLPLLLLFRPSLLSSGYWLLAVISGLAFGFGLHSLFLAIRVSEATHIAPFGGAILTVLLVLLSAVFLGERLSSAQLAGVFAFLLASVLFSFETTESYSGAHRGYIWVAVSAALFSVAHLTTKVLYNQYDFLTAFVWSKAPMGFVGLAFLSLPSVRRALARSAIGGQRRNLTLVVGDKLLGIGGNVALQYAMAAGSVTLVNALAGAQYAFIFLAVLFLTRRAPRIFREYFTRREIRLEIIALALSVIGAALVAL